MREQLGAVGPASRPVQTGQEACPTLRGSIYG
jgi:hypothetical protein